MKSKQQNNNHPGWMQVIKSVLAAAIGVQKRSRHEEDFKSDTIWPFVFGGIIFTVLFVVGLLVIVALVS